VVEADNYDVKILARADGKEWTQVRIIGKQNNSVAGTWLYHLVNHDLVCYMLSSKLSHHQAAARQFVRHCSLCNDRSDGFCVVAVALRPYFEHLKPIDPEVQARIEARAATAALILKSENTLKRLNAAMETLQDALDDL
jgi:hypothetical protein